MCVCVCVEKWRKYVLSWFTDSISYDDNHYSKRDVLYLTKFST